MIDNCVEKILSFIDYLPPLPYVAGELITLLHNENSNLRDIIKVIEKDPSLSVNVLKTANSAFYGLSYKVSSIEHAVNLIGLKEVASLCLSWGITTALKPAPGTKTMDLKAFWEHSIATGIIAKIFCKEFHIRIQDSLYLAGLIHDIGKVVLDRFTHEIYSEAIRLTYEKNISLREAEKEIIGEFHDKVGGYLLSKWKLPDMFVEVAAHHHSIGNASDKNIDLVAIISLSNQIARLKGFGFDGNMQGIILTETEAFEVIRNKNPELKDADLARFIMDLDRADNDIAELEKMINVS